MVGKHITTCLFGWIFFFHAAGQHWNTDSLAISIPSSVTKSPEAFADYLTSRFPDGTDRVKALYSWISHSIVYDVSLGDEAGKYETTEAFVLDVLKTKKTVCQGYAEVFTTVCNRMGIPALTIHGYTRIDGRIQAGTGHAWNVAKIDGKWFLFDPTWGSGFLYGGRYKKSFSSFYCFTPPDSLINTHMPLDPIWQLRDYPLTHDQFIDGFRQGSVFYHYADSLDRYFTMDEISQAEATLRRAVATHANRAEIHQIFRKYNDYVVNLKCNDEITRFNEASEMLSQAIDSFNAYQEERFRRGTRPDKLRAKLAEAAKQVQAARQQAETLDSCISLSSQEIQGLLRNIREVETAVATEYRKL